MAKQIYYIISKIADLFRSGNLNFHHNCLPGLILLLPLIFFSASCGKKAKTDLTYQPPVAPIRFQVSRQNDGLWKVGGGIITQVGIFSLEQTFDMRDEYTYLVLRNREKGTDQVYKLGVKGYVEIHTQGEHKLRLQRDENKVVVDVETISGNFELSVYPDSQAIARIELGGGQPDLVLYSDKRLAVEYDSVFWSDDSLPLDSIRSVTYQKDLYSRSFVFNWKNDVKNQPQSFVLKMNDLNTADANFLTLQKTVAPNAPKIIFEEQTAKGLTILLLTIAICFGLLLSLALWLLVAGFSGQGKSKAVLGILLFPAAFAGLAITGLTLARDMEIVMSVFN